MREVTLKIGESINLGNGIVLKLRGSLGNVAKIQLEAKDGYEVVDVEQCDGIAKPRQTGLSRDL